MNSNKAINIDFTILGILTLALIVFKIIHPELISWLWVFSPVWIPCSLMAGLFLLWLLANLL